MNYISEFSFEYPWAFLLLIPYLFCKFFCTKSKVGVYFSNVKVLDEIVKNTKDYQKYLESLIVFYLIVALANPIVKKEFEKQITLGHEILINIDASDSMSQDNRFNITKAIVDKFIDKRKDDSLALMLFAQNVYIASPFTYDKKPLKDILRYTQIGVAGNVGTALYESIYSSVKLFENSTAKNKVLILLTDGINTVENIPLEIALASIKRSGIRVYTIGVGQDIDFNIEVLNAIADFTGGKFYKTQNASDLVQIYEEIDSLEKSEIKTNKKVKIEYYYQWPLIVVLVLILAMIIVNRKKKKEQGK